MDKNNQEIFTGKTFQDLTKDIYENSVNKKKQIDILINEINNFIKTIDDVIIVAPIVKEMLEVSVKNDEHLVKLASVLQRIITKSISGSDDDSIGLTDQEKEDLIQTLQDAADNIQRESDDMDKVKERYTGVVEG